MYLTKSDFFSAPHKNRANLNINQMAFKAPQATMISLIKSKPKLVKLDSIKPKPHKKPEDDKNSPSSQKLQLHSNKQFNFNLLDLDIGEDSQQQQWKGLVEGMNKNLSLLQTGANTQRGFPIHIKKGIQMTPEVNSERKISKQQGKFEKNHRNASYIKKQSLISKNSSQQETYRFSVGNRNFLQRVQYSRKQKIEVPKLTHNNFELKKEHELSSNKYAVKLNIKKSKSSQNFKYKPDQETDKKSGEYEVNEFIKTHRLSFEPTLKKTPKFYKINLVKKKGEVKMVEDKLGRWQWQNNSGSFGNHSEFFERQ